MISILITGGSGLIGTRLTQILKKRDYAVTHLSRRKNKKRKGNYFWDASKGVIEEDAFKNTNYIIHLAGDNLGEGFWTRSKKQEILNSRTRTTDLLYQKLKTVDHKLQAFISASAIGIYKKNGPDFLSESSPPDNDFLGEVCQKWERSVDKISELGIRTIKIRTGIVLSKEGGALPKMTAPVKMFAGAAIGSGNQYMSWIHMDDICGIYVKAIQDSSMEGVFNGVSPYPVTNKQLTRLIATILKKPLLLPNIPKFVVKCMFGEKSCLLLDGQKVSAEKIISAGYQFAYPEIEPALKSILT